MRTWIHMEMGNHSFALRHPSPYQNFSSLPSAFHFFPSFVRFFGDSLLICSFLNFLLYPLFTYIIIYIFFYKYMNQSCTNLCDSSHDTPPTTHVYQVQPHSLLIIHLGTITSWKISKLYLIYKLELSSISFSQIFSYTSFNSYCFQQIT